MTKQFNNNISKIGKLMSLESKVNVVGSASIKRSIYYSDYDLFESVTNTPESAIYNHFKALFSAIKLSPNAVITDFKMGHENNKPLRWDMNEIHKGENNGVTFSEALKQKGMIKCDVVALVGGRFTELSEVYNITLSGKSNMDYSKEAVIADILKEYKEHVHNNNYMKALKRLFSIMKLTNPNNKQLDVIMGYFNSPIGLLYRAKADLETILLILNYNKFSIDDVKNSLQVLKEQVSAFGVDNNIEKISSMRTKSEMKIPLIKQINKMKEFINRDAKAFLLRNNL